MIAEREQFRVLYRDFLSRLIDVETLSAAGDPQTLYTYIVALLAGFNAVVAFAFASGYAGTSRTGRALMLAATGDQQFLAATTLTVVGLFGVLAWGGIFPDRRDCLVLGPLPVRTRTIFLAKLAAVGTGLGICLLAVNAFTGIVYPAISPNPAGGARGFLWAVATYWLTMAAAGLFAFCVVLAIQGLAVLLLPYWLYQRLSGALQLATLFLFVGGFFLTPGGALVSVTADAHRNLMMRLPSYWFLGLYQQLQGPAHEVFRPLAERGLAALGIVASIAAMAYALAYFRGMRRVIEQPDIAPSDRSSWLARLGAAAAAQLLRKPVDYVVVTFAARGLARSAHHRLMLAAYLGVAAAVALAYSRSFLFEGSRLYASSRRHMALAKWDEPNVALLVASWVFLTAAVLGARAVYELPIALKANWVFRVTMVHSPRSYFEAVRKSLYLLMAAPVWLVAAVAYLAIWPPAPVFAHLLVFTIGAAILVERSLAGYRKIPFACSYSPGKGEYPLTVTFGVAGILLWVLVDWGTRIELHAMGKGTRFLVVLLILGTLAWRSRKRWTVFANAPAASVQFDDSTLPGIAPLDLRRDGMWGAERFLDLREPPPEVPLRRRILRWAAISAAVVAVTLAAGTLYEEIGGRMSRRGTAPHGTLVDIGGRSLHVYCVDGRGPTILFENGAGGVAKAWLEIQRQLAPLARSCAYDRAGFGWSDPGPFPQNGLASARDLRALVSRGAVTTPLVLVAESWGGVIARIYAGEYPKDVAGIVLVDSSHTDETKPVKRSFWQEEWLQRGKARLGYFLWRTGVLRFFFGSDWEEFEPRGFAEFGKVPVDASMLQARYAPKLKGKPLIVLTAGLPPKWASNPVEARRAVAGQKLWIESQKQLVRFSDRGRQVIVNSAHCIQCFAPEAIVTAVKEVLAEVRGEADFMVTGTALR